MLERHAMRHAMRALLAIVAVSGAVPVGDLLDAYAQESSLSALVQELLGPESFPVPAASWAPLVAADVRFGQVRAVAGLHWNRVSLCKFLGVFFVFGIAEVAFLSSRPLWASTRCS